MQKLAQEPPRHVAPKHTPATMEAYPDYSKSLAHQRREEPRRAGIARAVGTGITGAALGALVARILTTNRKAIAGGAALGGAVGAGVGYGSGKHEAESDYSKMLFLRRRLGMNEPGEFEALQKHPALISQMIDKQGAVKQAMSPKTQAILKVLGVTGAGVAGWGVGTEGTSRILDYHDDPGARHMGGLINAANFATMAGLAMHGKGEGLGKVLREHAMLPASMIGMELIPSAKKAITQSTAATQDQAGLQMAPSIHRAVTSPTGQGAGVGAGLAGLAAVMSGLTRARSEREIGRDTSRPTMIAKDFGKYVLPAALAGGVIGSLRKKQV